MTDLTDVLDYARTFLGVPYGAWDGEAIPRDDSTPFYACNGPPPDRELVDRTGCLVYRIHEYSAAVRWTFRTGCL